MRIARLAVTGLLPIALSASFVWAQTEAPPPAQTEEPPPAAAVQEKVPVGDLSFLVGGLYPQDSFVHFSDDGPVFTGRAAFHIPGAPGLIPWADLGAVFFSSPSGLTEVNTGSLIVVAKEERSEWALYLHGGLQLGSPSRRGFFRPRASAGPGFYVFFLDRDLTLPGDTEPYYTKSISLGRAGWRGMIGSDFFFTSNWGVSLEFLYDQAWSVENGQDVRYAGFQIGVALPLERALQEQH